MTSGSLWKNILLFSLPLMGSQVLEVLFNLSDVAVVGRFADYMALGAVGSTTLLVTLFTGILIGMGAGVNVRVAHELGAENRKGTEETIHTSLLLCAIAGLLVCVVCLLFSGQMLSMMNTKPELMDQAVLYMKIYALGMPAMAVYNFGNGVLSARGDTKRPLIYLSIAGVINVLLNLFFVIVCHMAAAGVATASAIALYISAALVMIHLLRRKDECRVSLRKLRLHPKACKAVLLLGIPTGLQNGIFAIANLFVQAGVNSFDAVTVSGNAAAANADSLIYNVMFAFYTACASFIGQNWGAGNKKRMLKTYGISLTYAFIAGAILGGLLLVFGPQFLSLFATEPAVIDAGMERIRIMGLQYRRFPWHRKKYPTDHHHHSGILCIPCHLVLYGVCTLPDHFLTLSPVYFLMGNYRLCGGSVLCCKLPENSDLILQIYSARRSIDLALFISFSRFMYICLYKADIIVYNYPVVLLRDAVIPA